MKRVAMVGAGMIAAWHCERWKRLPVELVGHFDRREERALAAAERFGGRVYRSLEELVSDVDIIDVCTPTPAHKEGVLAAAAAGKAIVCEKPLARHLRDAEEMIEACERAGVRLFVAQVVRFFPQYAQAKATLDSGALGSPAVLRTLRGGAFPRPDSESWYNDFRSAGGVIMDLSIHDLDFARWCFGEVERVFARGLTFAGESQRDHSLITLRFRNGALGHIEGSWAFPPGEFRTSLELAGSGGLLSYSSRTPLALELNLADKGAADSSVTNSSGNPLAPEDDPYYRELEHFLNCLETGEPFAVSPLDGLMALKLALASIASLKTGLPVDVASFVEEAA